MSTFRRHVRPADHYTIVTNAVLRDASLSLKAKGLLAMLLSFSSDFDVNEHALVGMSRDGRDGFRAAVQELERAGYLVREQQRTRDGKLSGSRYWVSDSPSPENPTTAKPTTAKPTHKEEQFQEDQNQEDQLTLLSQGADSAPTVNQIADRLAKDYHSRNRMEGYMGILAQVRKALSVGYRPDEVETALKRIEMDGQTVTAWRLKQTLESSQERRDARMFDENGMLR